MNDRSPVYYYSFDTKKVPGSIVCKGVQFVTQTVSAEHDDTEFNTLQAAEQGGHMQQLIDCWGGAKILQELAAVPDGEFNARELLERFLQFRKQARVFYPQ